jgi:hypothetical protein
MDAYFQTDKENAHLPYGQRGDFAEFVNGMVNYDVVIINKSIIAMGQAVTARYVDAFDSELMDGVFTACKGFNGQDRCWVMQFEDGKRNIGVGILPEQLPGAFMGANSETSEDL